MIGYLFGTQKVPNPSCRRSYKEPKFIFLLQIYQALQFNHQFSAQTSPHQSQHSLYQEQHRIWQITVTNIISQQYPHFCHRESNPSFSWSQNRVNCFFNITIPVFNLNKQTNKLALCHLSLIRPKIFFKQRVHSSALTLKAKLKGFAEAFLKNKYPPFLQGCSTINKCRWKPTRPAAAL